MRSIAAQAACAVRGLIPGSAAVFRLDLCFVFDVLFDAEIASVLVLVIGAGVWMRLVPACQCCAGREIVGSGFEPRRRPCGIVARKSSRLFVFDRPWMPALAGFSVELPSFAHLALVC